MKNKNKPQNIITIILIVLLAANLCLTIYTIKTTRQDTVVSDANTSSEASVVDISSIPVDEIVNYEEEVQKNKYFATIDSEEQAQEIADSNDKLELIDYSDSVATYEYSQPVSEFLDNTFGIDTYAEEVETTVESTESVVSDEDYTITLSQDNIYTVDEVAPYSNPGYQENVTESTDWYSTYADGNKGKGTVVAIIDSGCDISHPDLAQNIIGEYNVVDGTDVVTDYNSHGTHVAGIIAAADNDIGNIGVASEASLYIIKTDRVNASGATVFYTSDIVKALNKCIELGNIDVINMSLGSSTYEQYFKEAIENCADNGILVCCSAGNNCTDSPHYPSGYGIGMGVASYDATSGYMSSFSNYGDNYNIVAPGTHIYSTIPDGRYGYKSGTSMATPYVTGVAALIYSKYNIADTRAGSETVKQMLLDNASDTYVLAKDNSISVTGGVKVRPIFNDEYIQIPDGPAISFRVDFDTLQQYVSFAKKDGYEIYYTTDGTDPELYGKMWNGNEIRIQKAGCTYQYKAVYTIDGIAQSVISKSTTYVSPEVITQKQLKYTYIETVNESHKIAAGSSKQLYTYSLDYRVSPVPEDRLTWSSSNTKIATVNKTGKVTVKKNAKSGKTCIIKAIIGDTTYKFKVIVK